jgi:hypothetical protein
MSRAALRFDLHAAGALAPGVGSLAELLTLARTGQAGDIAGAALPAPQSLPANERRRASQVVRLSLACAEQALQASPFAVEQLRTVFASDEGTGEVCHQMLQALVTTREISPLVFHNSVHNAPSGYLSIGYQNRQPALSVSLGRESFASGLLCAVTEAQSTGQPVLFVAYDAPIPQPLQSLLPIEHATATAWIITAGQAANDAPALGRFALSLHDSGGVDRPATPAWLPAAWADNSSAQGFVALALLANESGACELPLGAQHLRVERVCAC